MPCVAFVWPHRSPLHGTDATLIEKGVFLLLAPHLRHAVVPQLGGRMYRLLYCYRDADADLNTEDIMCRAREFRILAYIAVQIEMPNAREIFEQMFPHPAKGILINERVI